MRIGLIRHGETDWNVAERFQGTTDIPLNAHGEEQAFGAARLIDPHRWSAIYASPLQRASRTAEIIADETGIPGPSTIPELIERSFGTLEGQEVRVDGRRRTAAELTAASEPADEVVARTFGVLERLVREHPDDEVLAVSHGTVIRLLVTELLGRPAPRVPNTSLTIIEALPDALDPDAMPERRFLPLLVNGYPLSPSQRPASGAEPAA